MAVTMPNAPSFALGFAMWLCPFARIASPWPSHRAAWCCLPHLFEEPVVPPRTYPADVCS